MSRRWVIFGLMVSAFAMLSPRVTPAQGTFVDGYVSTSFDSNTFAAILEEEEADDFTVLVGLSVARAAEISSKSGILFRGAVEYERHLRFEELSNISAKFSIDYRWQASRDPLAPWIRGLANISFTEYQRSRIRSGVRFVAGPTVGKRISDRITLAGGYRWDYRSTPQGNTFNVAGHRLFGRVSYDLTHSASTFLSYTKRWGDSVSTVQIVTPQLFAGSRRFEADPAFGPIATSWRFRSNTQIVQAGLDYDLDDTNSISVFASLLHADGNQGDDYRRFSGGILFQRKFR